MERDRAEKIMVVGEKDKGEADSGEDEKIFKEEEGGKIQKKAINLGENKTLDNRIIEEERGAEGK